MIDSWDWHMIGYVCVCMGGLSLLYPPIATAQSGSRWERWQHSYLGYFVFISGYWEEVETRHPSLYTVYMFSTVKKETSRHEPTEHHHPLHFNHSRFQLWLGSQSFLHILQLGNRGLEASSSLACGLLAGSKPSHISCCCLEELILRAGGEISEIETLWIWTRWELSPVADLHAPRSLCAPPPPQQPLKPLNLRSYMVGELCEEAIYVSNEMRIYDVFFKEFHLEMDK